MRAPRPEDRLRALEALRMYIALRRTSDTDEIVIRSVLEEIVEFSGGGPADEATLRAINEVLQLLAR